MEQGRGEFEESPESPPRPPRVPSPNHSRTGVGDSPVFKVTAAIADGVTQAEVYEALVDRVADAVEASSAGLWLVSEDGSRRAALVRSRGYTSEAAGAMEDLEVETASVMPVLDCILSARPVWIPSQAALYERYPHLKALATDGRS